MFQENDFKVVKGFKSLKGYIHPSSKTEPIAIQENDARIAALLSKTLDWWL